MSFFRIEGVLDPINKFNLTQYDREFLSFVNRTDFFRICFGYELPVNFTTSSLVGVEHLENKFFQDSNLCIVIFGRKGF